MSNITQAQKTLIKRILQGPGTASPSQRQAAFNNSGLDDPLSTIVDKVATQAHQVTDNDITAARESGLTEDQVFEIVVCAAVGQSTRQYNTALAALDAVSGNATRKD